LCDDVLELSVHGITKFGGDWLAYSQSKQRESERLGAALDRAKRERDAAFAARAEKMSRQEKRQRRGANMAARGGEPRILLGTLKRRAQVTQGSLDVGTIEQAQGAVRTAHEAFTQLKIEQVMYADLLGNAIAEQKLVAHARDFNIRRRDWLFARDLSFTWRGNVRVAIAGSNGAGKTTLLKAILGETFETRGELRRGELETLYIDQQCSSLNEEGTVFDNLRAVSCRTDSEIRNALARFLFTGDSVFQKVSNLSGGERLRAALARGFLSSEAPELVVLDEPTNNLDLANVEFLERLIREYRGALIVISHDETFLRNCGVEHILDLSDSTHEAVRRTHG
jgi:ATPase subunit of ABC transporter with duplicated ATPase domains